MKKEIKLIDAVNRWGEGKDTLFLVPNVDSEGHPYYVPNSFAKHMEKLSNSIFLIEDDEDSVYSNIEKANRELNEAEEAAKPKQDVISEQKKEHKVDTPISSNAKQAKIDIGKLVALNNAGWTVANIAGELRVSKATVYKYLKKIRDGEIVPEGYIDGYDEPEE
jgi:DNA-binding transcriptional regulator GbsR (MarR family)